MPAGSSSRLVWKTALFLVIAVLGNSFGNLMLALGMNRMPPFTMGILTHYAALLIRDPYIIGGTALTATYTIAELSLFSWADLSYVIPCTASSYIISTLLAQFVMGEHVHFERWMGVLLIFCGVVLVAETPITTKPHGPELPNC